MRYAAMCQIVTGAIDGTWHYPEDTYINGSTSKER